MNDREKRNLRKGFTLVELMVVAVIVAILAAVAIPLMTANRSRAIGTEAESALGTIRVALRVNFSEANAYNIDSNGNTISSPIDLDSLTLGDLEGRYFAEADYSLSDMTATTYTITGTGSGDALGIIITLNQDGTITRVLP